MNLSIETLVTAMIAVLVAGIIGIAVFGESTDFIDWSSEETDTASCDLQETQAELACPDKEDVEEILNGENSECFDVSTCGDFCDGTDDCTDSN